MTHDFAKMTETLRTQDNACTSQPFYCVMEKKRVYGLDTNYYDDVVWIDDCNDYREVTDDEDEGCPTRAELEAKWEKDATERDGFTRTAYVDTDVFVTGCFTKESAEAYIKANAHNLKKPFVFVYSLNRNHEMIAVRELLLAGVVEVKK